MVFSKYSTGSILSKELKRERSRKKRKDNDGFWKDLIEAFAILMIQSMLPELYKAMDLTKEIEFNVTELRDTLPNDDEHCKARFVDGLWKVYLKDGSEAYVLLHIEIQDLGGDDIDFRMARYFAKIFGHTDMVPVALLILTAPRKGPTDVFEKKAFGTEFTYRWTSFDLTTLNEDELSASDNPFDLILYAIKRATRVNRMRSHNGKKLTKTDRDYMKAAILEEFALILLKKGWKNADINKCLKFVERFIEIPKALREEVYDNIHVKGGKKMLDYMTYPEEVAYERAMAKLSVEVNAKIAEANAKIAEAKTEAEAKGRAEGMAKGKAEGIIECMNKMIDSLLTQGADLKMIAQASGKSLAYIRKRKKTLTTA